MVGETGVRPLLQMRKVGLRDLGRTSLGHVASVWRNSEPRSSSRICLLSFLLGHGCVPGSQLRSVLVGNGC